MPFLFTIPERFCLLVHGEQVYEMTIVSFFITNCVLCMSENGNNFNCHPPPLEEYIPLSEVIKSAPNIEKAMLGEVYRYF